MTALPKNREWIKAVEAARFLGGIPQNRIPKLAARGLIGVLRVPLCEPRYALADVMQLAEASLSPAKLTDVVSIRAEIDDPNRNRRGRPRKSTQEAGTALVLDSLG